MYLKIFFVLNRARVSNPPRFIYTSNIGQVTRPPLLRRILNKGSTYIGNNH